MPRASLRAAAMIDSGGPACMGGTSLRNLRRRWPIAKSIQVAARTMVVRTARMNMVYALAYFCRQWHGNSPAMFTTEVLVDRIRSEYVALPGLKLTRDQACRLWGVDDDHCAAAFEILLAEGFLHRTGTGKFVALPRPAAAYISAATRPEP